MANLSYSDITNDYKSPYSQNIQVAHEYKAYEGPTTVELQFSFEKEEKEEKEEKKQEEKKEEESESKTETNTTDPPNTKHKADKFFTIMLVMYIFVGILAFMIVEDFTFINSFYFRIISLFHVGFGDIVPTTHPGKILNAIFMITDMCAFAYIYWRILYSLFMGINNKCVKNKYYVILLFFCLLLLFYCGTLVFVYDEGHNGLDAFVWTFSTISSVGYGYITPSSASTKIFCIFYIIVGYLLSLYLTVYVLYRLKIRYVDNVTKSDVKKIGSASPSLNEVKSDDKHIEKADLFVD